ncbi:hypothetical protein DFH06DRAFT_1146757 [Mycena polygramma]|nr:hypothetical protein DFH06DRAFT_1146757 [Mycena polygramma]
MVFSLLYPFYITELKRGKKSGRKPKEYKKGKKKGAKKGGKNHTAKILRALRACRQRRWSMREQRRSSENSAILIMADLERSAGARGDERGLGCASYEGASPFSLGLSAEFSFVGILGARAAGLASFEWCGVDECGGRIAHASETAAGARDDGDAWTRFEQFLPRAAVDDARGRKMGTGTGVRTFWGRWRGGRWGAGVAFNARLLSCECGRGLGWVTPSFRTTLDHGRAVQGISLGTTTGEKLPGESMEFRADTEPPLYELDAIGWNGASAFETISIWIARTPRLQDTGFALEWAA